jgi:hypothetical protein
MNSELQKRLDELKAGRGAEREKLSKQRKEREAAFEAKTRAFSKSNIDIENSLRPVNS